ncbi:MULTISPECIES: hypothetical protein [unclassified Xanthomonas]|uniref:hypothetical protein n=1 Tax=unclassified Xanthomonas TaxID=2643310 RepID=UPI002B239B2F|nr:MULTISPECIES: hypothetical protein [unclassified Xanthomonas]MEA9564008.1 hypothetical protein [Xanthomonas sp. WHRI 8932A]MEA9634663.1 hypothetical protein [Xanthomonas sp. WHRI 8812E]
MKTTIKKPAEILFIIRMATCILMALFATPGLAKCLDKYYAVTGSIINEDGSMAADALVGVAWTENGEPAGPAISKANSKGEFLIHFRFRTFSGINSQGDECKGKLRNLSLSAKKSEIKSIHLKVPVESTTINNINIIKVPPLPLTLPDET